jgi:transposase-like protein
MIREFDSLYELMQVFGDEQKCIDHLRSIRWKNGPHCPYCGSVKVYDFSDKRTHKCGDCRQRFSIKVGTIFEDTKLPLSKWFAAIWMVTSHKKGIASTQLAKDLKITQKSAWFVLHRLRYAARTKSFNRPLKGSVESDEAYVGGKDKNKHSSKRAKGRGPAGKTPIMGLLERGGELRAMKIDRPTKKIIQGVVRQHVAKGADLHTDEFSAYQGLDGEYVHHTVHHASGEYVKHRFMHVNGIEGAWSHF